MKKLNKRQWLEQRGYSFEGKPAELVEQLWAIYFPAKVSKRGKRWKQWQGTYRLHHYTSNGSA